MLLCANASIYSIAHLHELGYDAIDIGLTRVIYNNDPFPHDAILDGEDWKKKLDRYIEQSKQLGVKISSTHLPYRYNFANTSDDKYTFCHEMAVRALKASEYLGAEWAVMHVQDPKDTVEYVKKLFADSGVAKVGIAVENALTRPIDELIHVVDTLQSEGLRVGICLDVGHCHYNKHFENDVPEVIRTMGKRIKVLHIHDNCRNRDMHKAPYTGTIKWEAVMTALNEVRFTGEFNFELQPEYIPKPIRAAYEKYCVEAGRYLISLYQNNGGERI